MKTVYTVLAHHYFQAKVFLFRFILIFILRQVVVMHIAGYVATNTCFERG